MQNEGGMAQGRVVALVQGERNVQCRIFSMKGLIACRRVQIETGVQVNVSETDVATIQITVSVRAWLREGEGKKEGVCVGVGVCCRCLVYSRPKSRGSQCRSHSLGNSQKNHLAVHQLVRAWTITAYTAVQ